MAIILFNAGLCRSVILQFLFRSSHRRCSARKGALLNFAKPTGKHLRLSLLPNKFIKNKTPAQVLSRESRETPKNTLFTEHLRTTVSVFWKTTFSYFCAFCVFCFESHVLNQDTKICVIMLCNFVM